MFHLLNGPKQNPELPSAHANSVHATDFFDVQPHLHSIFPVLDSDYVFLPLTSETLLLGRLSPPDWETWDTLSPKAMPTYRATFEHPHI